MNRREIAAAVAVGLYIVFFSMEPPAILRGVLDNVVGIGALFLAAAYVTVYQSKLVGGLLLLAVVLSGSRAAREGLVNPSWTPAKQTELDQVTATVTQLRGMGLSPESNNALRDAIARQATLNAEKNPATTPTAGTSTTTPAATPATTTVPAPTKPSTVASCNLENFTTQRRSLPQEYASF
jgi:hypothetical protein